MSHAPSSAERDTALVRLRAARNGVRVIADDAEFGRMALALVYLRFNRPADWRDWPVHTDLTTDGLLNELRNELGPGIDATLRAISNLSVMEHAMLVGIIDHIVERLGYSAAFQLLIEQSTWNVDVFFTPTSVVEVLVNTVGVDSCTKNVYDPFCRTGELLVAAALKSTSNDPARAPITVRGEVPDFSSQALARMNLRLHDIEGVVGQPEDSLTRDDIKYSIVLANPPFNLKEWAPHPGQSWTYGEPPAKNANFAWLQHILERLEPDGKAAVLMPNNAAFSANERERLIRERMVLAGCVRAIIALPPSLFQGTGIATMIWLLNAPNASLSEVVFVDAVMAGHMESRNHRELDARDIHEIVESLSADTAGINDDGSVRSISVPLAAIRERNFNLSPAAYLPGRQKDAVGSTSGLIDEWASETDSAQQSDSRARRTISSLARVRDVIVATTAWPEAPLIDVCKLMPGAPTKNVPVDSASVPVLKPKNLESGQLVGDTDMMASAEADKKPRYRVEKGDLLCVRTGTMGEVGLVTEKERGWIFGSGLICMRVKDANQLVPHFLAAYFMSPSVRDWIIRNAGGTSIPSISVTTLGTLQVPLPPMSVQQKIAGIVDELGANAAAHDRARQAAEELRDSLLPQFFSGNSAFPRA